MKQETEKLLTMDDLKDRLGIKDNRTLRSYMEEGRLDYVKVGRFYRFTEQHVRDFIYKSSSENIKYEHA